MTKSLGDRIYDRLSERQASGDPLTRDWFVAMVETEARAVPNDDDEFSGNAWTPKQLEELRARGAKLERGNNQRPVEASLDLKPMSQKTPSAIRTSTDAVTIADLSYARESLRNAVYDYVLRRFMQEAKPNNVNRAHIARVLQKKPEQITRWLGAPGNWTLDTVSDLLLAMGFDPVDIVAVYKVDGKYALDKG